MSEENQNAEIREEERNSFIKFSVDSSGEIHCDCEFDEENCSIDNFAEMFVQIFSGQLGNGTFFFLTNQLIEQDKEETAMVLAGLLKNKLDVKIYDKSAHEVVVKPTELAKRINMPKE